MEVVEAVLAEAAARWIRDNPTLRECRGAHAALHALDQIDVLDLENLIEIGDRFEFGLIGRLRFEEEIVGLECATGTVGDHVEHDEVAPTRVTHEAGVGPQPPDRVSGDGGRRNVVCRVVILASLGHMARVDPVGRDLVGVHVDERHEIFVGDMAVVALKEVVDDVLPVALDRVAEAVGERQLIDVGHPVGNLLAEIARLFCE